MPLILDRDSSLWFGNPENTSLGAITAYNFDSAEVEGAEPSVQVALVGWWMLADGGQPIPLPEVDWSARKGFVKREDFD